MKATLVEDNGTNPKCKLHRILIDGQCSGMIFLTANTIHNVISEMRKRNYDGEYEEHFAEMCAKQFAFDVAMNGYFHHYNCTGFIIHGGDYPEEHFYLTMQTAYDFILPKVRTALKYDLVNRRAEL